LELTLQNQLEEAFPSDTIEELRKGVRGGDVVQRVITRRNQVARILLWEAKRAKDWNSQWVGKLKDVRSFDGGDSVRIRLGTPI
jgi:hypothetical protein